MHIPALSLVPLFEQYAIDGYKVNALDYLLKPISYVDFLQAANKKPYNGLNSYNSLKKK